MERINIDPEVKRRLFEKFHGRCYYCGRQLTWGESTIDHVIPLAKDGKNRIDNFVLSCCECNNLKGNRSIEDFRIYIYSMIANALRYINNGLYNIETGELKFFGDMNKYAEIPEAITTRLNNAMKPTFKKYVSNNNRTMPMVTNKLTVEDFNSLQIDNPYETSGKIKESYPDEDWENVNTLVEKPFTALVGDSISNKEELEKINPTNNSKEMITEQAEDHDTSEENNDQNFVLCNEEEPKIKFKVAEFHIPKSISTMSKNFLNKIKELIENRDMVETESLITYYNMINDNSITEKMYNQISKELISKNVVNKHKKFRPRVISISYVNI